MGARKLSYGKEESSKLKLISRRERYSIFLENKVKMRLFFFSLILLPLFSCNENSKDTILEKSYIVKVTIIGNQKLFFQINKFKDSALIKLITASDTFLIKHYGHDMNQYTFSEYVNSVPSQYVHSKYQSIWFPVNKIFGPPNNYNDFKVNKTLYIVVSQGNYLFDIEYKYFKDGKLKQLKSYYGTEGSEDGLFYSIKNLIHSDTLNLWEAFNEQYDTKIKTYNYLDYDSIAVYDELDFFRDSFRYSNSMLFYNNPKN